MSPANSVVWGTLSSRTMMVMMMAMTPSLKASKRFVGITSLFASPGPTGARVASEQIRRGERQSEWKLGWKQIALRIEAPWRVAGVSRGPSGRIVVEIEPGLKRHLYSRLAINGLTLKEWLVKHARDYVSEPKSGFRLVAEARKQSYRARKTS